jgi:hypothetical protein
MNGENVIEIGVKKGTAPSFSADEELAEVRAHLAQERADGMAPSDPAIDELDISQLLDRAFSNARTDDGISAVRAEDDDFNNDFGDSLDPDDADADVSEPQSDTEPTPEGDAEAQDFGDAFAAAEESLLAEQTNPQASSGAPSGAEQGAGADSGIFSSGPSLDPSKESLNASIDMAQQKLGADVMEGVQAIQSPGVVGNGADQQVRVGLLQGLGLLGGAGLASLAKMVQAGGNTISTVHQQRQYNKLSGEVDSITENMDTLVTKMNQNGLASGLSGLKGAHRDEFVQEFFSEPRNKVLLDDLVGSVGNLATKASKAAVVGAGAGLSADQVDDEINGRINSVRQKHKEMLDAIKDHHGVSLGDRLSNIASQIVEMIQEMFKSAAKAMGFGQRPGM